MKNQLAYRYPGPSSFQDTHSDRVLFFGRDYEKQVLLHMVLAERLIVCYALSGLGKTSLINVGLMKPLREKSYLPFRITFTDSTTDPLQTIFSKIEVTVKEHGIDLQSGDKTSLWHYFKTAKFRSAANSLLVPVLIFDQFEEIFTLHSNDNRSKFITQLAGLLRGRSPEPGEDILASDETSRIDEQPPEVKVVIALREDFLGQLEELSKEIPDILQNRFRLQPLSRDRAREAIVQPALVHDDQLKSPRFEFAPKAVEAMLDFLCKCKIKDRIVVSDELEPFQLQVLCHAFEERVARRSNAGECNITIKPTDLGGEEGMQRILKDFYNDKIKCLRSFQIRKRVRRLFGDRLISDTNRRLSVEEEQIETKSKVKKEILLELVDNRLLRAEPRVGSIYYEISHDALIAPIRKAHKEYFWKQMGWTGGLVLFVVLGSLIGIMMYNDEWELKDAKAQVDAFEAEKNRTGKEMITASSLYDGYNPYRNLARVYASRGNCLEAFSVCEDAVKRGTAPNNIWSDLFEVLKRDLNESQVVKMLDEAAGYKSADAKYYYFLGLEYNRIKETEKEIKSYYKVISLDSTIAGVYNNLGNVFFNSKKYEDAIKMYQKVVYLDSASAYAYFNLGNAFWNTEKYEDAIKMYWKAISFDSTYVSAYSGLGNAFDNAEKYEDATKMYYKAISLDSTYVYAYNGLGNVFLNTKMYEDAIKMYYKVIDLDSTYVYAYNGLGNVFSNTKKYEDAIIMFRKAISLDSTYVDAYNSLGVAFIRTGEHEEAIKMCQKAIGLDSTYSDAYLNLGVCYMETIMPPDFRRAYLFSKKAYTMDPHDPSALLNLAEGSLTNSLFDEALSMATKALNDTAMEADLKFTMHFVSISALLLLEKTPEAYFRLRQFIINFSNLPGDYQNRWTYKGSRYFISTTDRLKEFDRNLLLQLIDILEAPKSEADKKLIDFKQNYTDILKANLSTH